MPSAGLRLRTRGRGAARLNVNLTSLIDVTFLLLIYFMVATSITLGEEVYRLDLPDRSGTGAASDPFKLDEDPLRIEVVSTGVGPAQYRLHVSGPHPQPATFDDLFSFLRAAQVSPNTTNGVFATDHPIIIQPSRTTRWDHAVEAFNAAAKAKYTNVTFAAPG